MNPQPKVKPKKKIKIDWEGFAIPKQSIKLSPYEYAKLKKKVHELDGWRCLNPECTNIYTAKELTVHHIYPAGRLRIDTVENCGTLCLWCHNLVEDKILYLDFEKLLRERRK